MKKAKVLTFIVFFIHSEFGPASFLPITKLRKNGGGS